MTAYESGDAERQRRPRGLLDTSAIIDLDLIEEEQLPVEIALAAVTIAELAAGPHATEDSQERAARIERLQVTEATFDQIPFDVAAARAYGRIYAELLRAGRKARGRRALDMLIAATALANGLPLYTRNPDDFDGLARLLDVVDLSPRVADAASEDSAANEADS